jgi:hypothetical protein
LIRDGLILRHRLPRLWAMVQDGAIEAFRARRVADLVAGHPDDVCAHVDEQVAPIAATAGVVTLDRLLDEALLTLHADQVELDRLEALDARHVTVDESSINHTGVADLSARADWADLSAFDDAVAAVAARLAEQDEADGLPPESLDIRRARALGILADPASAQALLEGKSTPARSRRTDLLLHLSTDALQNRSFFGRDGRLDMTLLADAVRDWCGRSDTDLHVHPVIDLNEHERVDQHDASAPMATRIELSHDLCLPLVHAPGAALRQGPSGAVRRRRRDVRLQPHPAVPPTSSAQDPPWFQVHDHRARHLVVADPARPPADP